MYPIRIYRPDPKRNFHTGQTGAGFTLAYGDVRARIQRRRKGRAKTGKGLVRDPVPAFGDAGIKTNHRKESNTIKKLSSRYRLTSWDRMAAVALLVAAAESTADGAPDSADGTADAAFGLRRRRCVSSCC